MAKKEIHMKSMGTSDEFIQRIAASPIIGVISDLRQTSGTSYTNYLASCSIGDF